MGPNAEQVQFVWCAEERITIIPKLLLDIYFVELNETY